MSTRSTGHRRATIADHRDFRPRAAITGTGRALPDDVWTSAMVEAEVDRRSTGWRIPKGLIQMAAGVVERRMVTLDRFGNTAAASIPLALDVALEEGRARPGDKVLLVGGAAGFSAGVIPLVL